MDRLKHNADRSILFKSKAYTDFQMLNTPTQIRLMKVNHAVIYVAQVLSIMHSFLVTSANIAIHDISLKTTFLDYYLQPL